MYWKVKCNTFYNFSTNNVIDKLKLSEQSTSIQVAAYFEKKWREEGVLEEEEFQFALTILKKIIPDRLT